MNAVKLGATLGAVVLVVFCLSWWLGPEGAYDPEPAAEADAAAAAEGAADDLATPETGPVADLERRALDEPAPDAVPAIAAGIRGRVIDATGAGVAAARVLAANREGRASSALDAHRVHRRGDELPRFETRTDEQGRFELAGPDPGPLRLAVRAEGFAPLDHDDRYLAEGAALDVGDLVLAPGVVLSGSVVDADGAPVPGAILSREEEGEGFFAPTLRAPLAETASDGGFRLTLAPGPWKLHVEAEGHPARVVTGLELDPVVRDDLVIRLERQWTIAGRVVAGGGPEGADLSTIEVRLAFVRDQVVPPGMLNEHRSQSVPCAADGTFRFPAVRSVEEGEPSRYRLHAYRGYGNMATRMSEELVVHAGDEDVALSLFATAGIDFQLVDRATGAPISDPRVSLAPGRANHIVVSGTDSLRAEAGGRFHVTDIVPWAGKTETWLWIAKEGYFHRVVPGIAFTPGSVTDVGRVELSPAPTLRVLVVDAATDRPVEGASVTAERPGVPGFGQAFDENTPPTDYLPKQDKATTDADGVARVRVPLDEEALVSVAHEDYATRPPLSVLATEVGESSLTVELQLGGTIEVAVDDGLGGRKVGVDVFGKTLAADGRGKSVGHMTTDSTGTARFLHLAPARHEFRLADPPRAVGETWQAIDVAAGETRVLHLTAPVKVTLEGRITEAGVPLAGAELHAVPGAPEDPESYLPWNDEGGPLTDTQGRFRMEPLEVGEWTLILEHDMRTLRDHVLVTVAREAPPVLIDLDVTEVAGTVTSPSGAPFAGEAVYAFRARTREGAMNTLLSGRSLDEKQLLQSHIGLTRTDAAGRYRLRGVPPGEPLLVAAIPEGCQAAVSAPFAVDRGAVREGVDLAPPPAGRLVVRLTVPEEKRRMLRFYRISAVAAHTTWNAKRWATADSGGGAILRHLSPGAWTVEVTKPFGGTDVVAGPTEVTVEAGGTAELAFEIP